MISVKSKQFTALIWTTTGRTRPASCPSALLRCAAGAAAACHAQSPPQPSPSPYPPTRTHHATPHNTSKCPHTMQTSPQGPPAQPHTDVCQQLLRLLLVGRQHPRQHRPVIPCQLHCRGAWKGIRFQLVSKGWAAGAGLGVCAGVDRRHLPALACTPCKARPAVAAGERRSSQHRLLILLLYVSL